MLDVVDALTDSGALPTDFKQLLEVALPIVLRAREDRQAYENKIVDQAEKALLRVQAAFEQKHAEAVKAQDEVIAPAEHQRRTEAKKVAEEDLEAAKAKLEASREVQSAARQAFHDAQSAWKSAQKDAACFEREMQAHAGKKTLLSHLLANEFERLVTGTSCTKEGHAAVKKLVKCGKECNLDETLLKTFPLTCKKEPSTRSEFEEMMITSLKKTVYLK